MIAVERYEKAWNAFQIHLNHNPKVRLLQETRSRLPFLFS